MRNLIISFAMEPEEQILDTMPKKSAARYERQFRKYQQFCIENHLECNGISLQKYVLSLRNRGLKASSIKSMVSCITGASGQHGVKFSQTSRDVIWKWAKKEGKGESPKQSSIFTEDDVVSFLRLPLNGLSNAQLKVSMIIAFYGMMRIGELHSLQFTDIDYDESCCKIRVVIRYSKTDQAGAGHTFYIPETIADIRLHDIVMAYKFALSQYLLENHENVTNQPFFRRVGTEECFVKTACGVAALGSFAKRIAIFLGKKNPESYTGHCFRRSAATNLAENGATVELMNKMGRWTANGMADHYTKNTEMIRKEGADLFLKKTSDAHVSAVSSNDSCHSSTDVRKILADISNG